MPRCIVFVEYRLLPTWGYERSGQRAKLGGETTLIPARRNNIPYFTRVGLA